MTLRLRLVLALVALVTVAQGAFLAVVYVAYRDSQFSQLDSELRSYAPAADSYLDQLAHGPRSGGDGPVPGYGLGPPIQGHEDGGPLPVPPPGTFAELLAPSGAVESHFDAETDKAQPKLPAGLAGAPPAGRIFTVGATQGSTLFRVIQIPAAGGGSTVVAVPTTAVTDSLAHLLLIEGAAIGALVVVLSAGSWLVLRRGLRPLERMARTAGRISRGDLSPRVNPAGGPTEVGQLGLALNTMLDGIEEAFARQEETEQRLRQFLADASHELRTPLTSIQGFAELFRVGGDQSRVDLPTILRRIEEESARMRVLVDDLLLLARLDQHRPIERRPVDLAVLAADACSDAVAQDPDRHVTLDAPEALVVHADESHLRQAVSNLVGNALRHTPPGTSLEVACRRLDGYADLSVRDHGAGLDGESLQHVFDRFWQGDKGRAGSGAGLGLSIVAAVAAEHGGRATATNAPGGGAVFTLTIPIEA